MKTRLLLIANLLLIATPLFAGEKTDVLIMKNGDRITCEVKNLSDGVLSVSVDYVDGRISLDWAKVARLESKQRFAVFTQDGRSFEGILSSVEAPDGQTMIQVQQDMGNVVEVDRSQIVRATQVSQNFLRRFNGALNSGLSYTKGNEARQYNFSSDVDYVETRWSAGAAFNSNLDANSGTTTSTRNQLALTSNRLLPWDNYFYGGQAGFLQSSVQGINQQFSLGGGIGHYFINNNRTSIKVLAGFAWQGTSYKFTVSTESAQNVATGLVTAEGKFFKFKRTNLLVTGTLLPALNEPGRLYFATNATYFIKLFRDLNWNVSFYGNWDTRPPAGFTGSDYGTSSGLSWKFGNR
jgi:putative salt-induced outer membrane protein YdiY